jgi:hypothetical protein
MNTRDTRRWMSSKRLALLLPAFLAGALTQAVADPIPIDGPVVITQSGSYVVTRDFHAIYDYAIRLVGSITVDIDFAGHTLGSFSTVVMVRHPNDDPQSPTVTLHDGRMMGGYGAYAWTNRGHGMPRVTMTRMTLEGAYTWIEDGSLTVNDSRLVNSSMTVDGNFSPGGGTFGNNDVLYGDIVLMGSGGWIHNNRIDGASIILGGSYFGPSGSITGNTLLTGSIEIGQSGPYIGNDVNVRGNDILGAYGAILVGNVVRFSVAGNRLASCGPTGRGIVVSGLARLGTIQGNIIPGSCASALWFGDMTSRNVYQENVVTNTNRFRVHDDGDDNVDGGGNKAIGFWKPLGSPVE